MLNVRTAWTLLLAMSVAMIAAHALYGVMHDMNAAAIAATALEIE